MKTSFVWYAMLLESPKNATATMSDPPKMVSGVTALLEDLSNTGGMTKW